MSEKPPPLPGESPDEPHIKHLGRFFTESEYQLAKRHNAIRWIISMGLGIPALLILAWLFSFLIAVFIAMALLPSVYFGATAALPGSKKHGTTLYKRYHSSRSLALRDFARKNESNAD